MLIKGYDARGIVWYTNYESRKGQELAGNPYAALQFHWVELERVVRIEGRVEKVERRRERCLLRQPAARFAHRRLGQPAERGDRRPRRAGGERGQVRRAVPALPPRPPHWGGYRLVPDRWEFWQGRKSRLHDRLRYRREDGAWVRERLAP